jgi:hypothetical protein
VEFDNNTVDNVVVGEMMFDYVEVEKMRVNNTMEVDEMTTNNV